MLQRKDHSVCVVKKLRVAIVTPGFSPSLGSGLPLGILDTLVELRKFFSISVFSLVDLSGKAENCLKFSALYDIEFHQLEGRLLSPPSLKEIIFKGHPSPASPVLLTDTSRLDPYDVIISVEPYSFLTYQLLRYSKKRGKKLVVLSFENLFSNPLFHLPPYSFFTNYSKREATCVWAVTHKTSNCLKKLGFQSKNIRVAYLGVNVARYGRCTKDRNKHTDNLRFLYLGGLAPNKGLPELIKAFEIISHAKGRGSVELIVCGDGSLKGWLIDLKRSKNIPIRYMGFIQHNKLPEVFSRAHIFVSPSRSVRRFGIKIWEEQFGMTLVEAMATGLPIISSNSGCIPEVVGNGNFLLRKVCVEELAGLLDKTLSLPRNKLIHIGRKNMDRVRKYFDAEVNAQRIHDIISI